MTLASLAIPLLLVSNVVTAVEVDLNCVEWFKRGLIKTGTKECEVKCATLSSDMATFMCSGQCERLCKMQAQEVLLAKFIFYPGLTLAERQLVVKYPKHAYIVYKQKEIAEDSTDRHFPNQDLNDESDAFRHFAWSGLLVKELGQGKAKEFLDAHEANPLQSERERQMDTFNNSRGQEATNALIKNKTWSIRNLEAKALEELRNGQLQVLSPGLPIPKEPK